MPHTNEYRFAEKIFEKLALESLPEKQSAYDGTGSDDHVRQHLEKHAGRLRWHIRHSLSTRQREVIELILKGKTERAIAEILSISQQVVHIYKWRAVNALRKKLSA
jgi:DNA-binding NarL/FixJ family response regulator